MKKRLQIVAAFLAGIMCAGGVVLAKSGSEMIEVTYDNIKLFMDGIEIAPKDANGNPVEPFIYNGTTYLPVRAVGNAMGKSVAWDGVEKVVYLGAKPGEKEDWMTQCPPYQISGSGATKYTLEENKYFTMSGKKYTNGFSFKLGMMRGDKGETLFNLDGKYDSVSFVVGHLDGSDEGQATLNVYLDGIIAYTKELKYDEVASKVTIPLEGALQMKVEVANGNAFTAWGFSEGVFE